MQRTCIALVFSILFGAALTACEGGAGCVIDSDCADFTQVCMEQRCVPVGTVGDAGRRDSGPEPDGGPEPDAGHDGGMITSDGGGDDGSMPDGGAPVCADVSGTWTMNVVTPGPCGDPTSGFAATITAAGGCMFSAATAVAGEPSLDGTFTLAEDGTLAGTLDVGGTGAPAICTGSVAGDGASITVICNGSCVVSLSRT